MKRLTSHIVTNTPLALAIAACSINANALDMSKGGDASDSVIQKQRQMLAQNTDGKGFGPQSPRNIDSVTGTNRIIFSAAPSYTQMNLCNIHFHKNAEHKGGEFTTYAGNGDGKGYGSGFKYNGVLTAKELRPTKAAVCPSKHGALYPGDTIELHYVHSTAQVQPGSSLGACLNPSNANPQLRVETQVFVLTNDGKGADLGKLTDHGKVNGLFQAYNIPSDTGVPVQYAGSTTGPSYNEKGSPLKVSWSVRPKVKKLDINSVGKWCKGNEYKEDHAHGVRNLVINPDLLSPIQ